MDPELAIMVAMFVAKEIKAEIEAQRAISVEQIAAKIAENLISISASRLVIQAEMKKYAAGGNG